MVSRRIETIGLNKHLELHPDMNEKLVQCVELGVSWPMCETP